MSYVFNSSLHINNEGNPFPEFLDEELNALIPDESTPIDAPESLSSPYELPPHIKEKLRALFDQGIAKKPDVDPSTPHPDKEHVPAPVISNVIRQVPIVPSLPKSFNIPSAPLATVVDLTEPSQLPPIGQKHKRSTRSKTAPSLNSIYQNLMQKFGPFIAEKNFAPVFAALPSLDPLQRGMCASKVYDACTKQDDLPACMQALSNHPDPQIQHVLFSRTLDRVIGQGWVNDLLTEIHRHSAHPFYRLCLGKVQERLRVSFTGETSNIQSIEASPLSAFSEKEASPLSAVSGPETGNFDSIFEGQTPLFSPAQTTTSSVPQENFIDLSQPEIPPSTSQKRSSAKAPRITAPKKRKSENALNEGNRTFSKKIETSITQKDFASLFEAMPSFNPEQRDLCASKIYAACTERSDLKNRLSAISYHSDIFTQDSYLRSILEQALEGDWTSELLAALNEWPEGPFKDTFLNTLENRVLSFQTERQTERAIQFCIEILFHFEDPTVIERFSQLMTSLS